MPSFVVFDIETSNLKANFAGIVLCAYTMVPGQEPKLFVKQGGKNLNSDDSQVVKEIITELNKHTVLIAHNGVDFDRPYLNSRALKHRSAGLDMPILDPYGLMIDPVKLARRHMKLSYNGLDMVAQFLGTKDQKTPLNPETWTKAILDRDPVAYQEIIEHCYEDVMVLDQITEIMAPFLKKLNGYGSA